MAPLAIVLVAACAPSMPSFSARREHRRERDSCWVRADAGDEDSRRIHGESSRRIVALATEHRPLRSRPPGLRAIVRKFLVEDRTTPREPRTAYVAPCCTNAGGSHGDVHHTAEVHRARPQDDQGGPQPAREGQATRPLDGGAEIKSFYLVQGRYDAVVFADAPSDEVVARFSLAIGSLGNVHTETLRAFTEDEYRKMVSALP